jgi:hypothetical protein
MRRRRPEMAAGRGQQMDPREETVRLLAILVRREAASQADAAVDMNKAGFGPTRIAELLGTTPNTVQQALQDAKDRARKRGGATRGG